MIEEGIKTTQHFTTAASTIAGSAGGAAVGHAVFMATAGTFTKLVIAIGIVTAPVAPIVIGAITGGVAIYGLSKLGNKTSNLKERLDCIAKENNFQNGSQ